MTRTCSPRMPTTPRIWRYILVFVLCGCGSTPTVQPESNTRASVCPAPNVPKQSYLHGERYTWCEDVEGVNQGPFSVLYTDGRPKLKFSLKAGRIHGLYQAFHPSGRRAIEQNYEHGTPVQTGSYWPPNGPPLRCAPSDCVERDLTLGRPFCLPEQVSDALSQSQQALDECSPSPKAGDVVPPEIVAQWWIDLMGRPYAIQVRSAHVDRSVAKCIEVIIKKTRFAAPFGDTCSIRMPFKLSTQ